MENVHKKLTTQWEGVALLKGKLDLNVQKFHFLYTEFKPWVSTRRKVDPSSSPQAAVWKACLPHSVVLTHRHWCHVPADSGAEVKESRILLSEPEEAAGFQRQRLDGVCFPGLWGKGTPPTSQTLPKGCPFLPGQLSYSSLKKNEFRYRDKGESFLTLPWGENLKKLIKNDF